MGKKREAEPKKAPKEKRKGYFSQLVDVIRTHRKTFIVYLILRAVVVAALVLSALRGEYESVFLCSLTLLLFLLPAFVERNFGIDLPDTLQIIVLIFIFAAEILGELQDYYVLFPYWDTMLHTINGFLCAAVGFALLDVFNRNPGIKFELSPAYLALVAFCFSMTVGVLWEFFEFGCDMILHTDMQKDFVVHTISSVALNPDHVNTAVIIDGINEVTVNGSELGLGGYLDIGLIDTMKDLIVNFIGAVIFSIIGFFYVRERGNGGFASRFIPTIKPSAADDHPIGMRSENPEETLEKQE